MLDFISDSSNISKKAVVMQAYFKQTRKHKIFLQLMLLIWNNIKKINFILTMFYQMISINYRFSYLKNIIFIEINYKL